MSVTQPPLYDTARNGLRTRFAAHLAAGARRRRLDRLFGYTGVGPGSRVLDLGCGALGLRALHPDLDITGLDLVERPAYPGPFVHADVTTGLPFPDASFDCVYASSLIEHIAPAARAALAHEIKRVGRGWFVQTPAFSFPIEPHALLPCVHWLPRGMRRRVWHLGVQLHWEEIELLRRRELSDLFGEPVLAERIGPLVKSWIAIRPIR